MIETSLNLSRLPLVEEGAPYPTVAVARATSKFKSLGAAVADSLADGFSLFGVGLDILHREDSPFDLEPYHGPRRKVRLCVMLSKGDRRLLLKSGVLAYMEHNAIGFICERMGITEDALRTLPGTSQLSTAFFTQLGEKPCPAA